MSLFSMKEIHLIILDLPRTDPKTNHIRTYCKKKKREKENIAHKFPKCLTKGINFT